jgi:DNA-directed RNA polymerase specialized sigma24 family protein
MAVGQKRGSHPAVGESLAVRGEDGRSVAASVDGLLLRVAHGDAEAFADVYDQVADAVHGLVRRIVGDQSRAEQVTAEALVEVWRSASRFSPAQGSGTDWVMAVARSRAMSHAGAAGNGRTPGRGCRCGSRAGRGEPAGTSLPCVHARAAARSDAPGVLRVHLAAGR